MNPAIIVVILALGIVFYLITTYNWFQTTLVRIKASIQEIGNMLKYQANLIPNLETSAKAYLGHEKEIYKSLTDARKSVSAAVESGSLKNMNDAADKVSSLLPKLQILVESNPELKAEKVVTR